MSEASSVCIGSCGTGHLGDNPVAFINGDIIPAKYPEGLDKTNPSEASYIASMSSSAAFVQAMAAPPVTTTSHVRSTATPEVRNIYYRVPPPPRHDISPNATHRDALQTHEYDTHNVFTFGILDTTYHGLPMVSPGKRPLIIGRGKSPGAGSVAEHWGGGNALQWRQMYWSILQALSMALLGIPMFGVDTCGYLGNSNRNCATGGFK